MTSRHPAVDAPRTEVATREGPAQVRVLPPDPAVPTRGSVLLGHGAGGQRDAADVLALAGLILDGWTVVLVDQPWRVAGRKVATPPPALDRAFSDVLAVLGDPGWRADDGIPLPRPWVLGGRSAGARVACRAAVDAAGRPRPGIAAVVCLAFPLHPPGSPGKSRAAELAGPVRAGVPMLVVQGDRDPFGTPAEVLEALGGSEPAALTLREVRAAHSPGRDPGAVRDLVREFLATLDRPVDGAVVSGPVVDGAGAAGTVVDGAGAAGTVVDAARPAPGRGAR